MKIRTKASEEQSTKYQYLAAIVANLLTMTYGVSTVWTSPNILILMSDETPLPSGKITMDEASSIASLTMAGGFFGNIMYGIVTGKIGRKIALISMAIPTIIGWLLVLFAQNVYYLYASRFLLGLVGGGCLIIVPLFVQEIAIDRVRGVLGSLLILIINFAILLTFIMGTYCDYFTTPKFVIVLTVLFVACFIFFPESPLFLLSQNKIEEATKSIEFYQNLRNKRHHEILQLELIRLKKCVNKTEKCNKNTFNWSEIRTNPGRKAFIIGIGLSLLNTLCGVSAALSYTAIIFKEAGSTLSPNISSIIVGAIQFLGSFVTLNLVDRLGRRFLYIASTIGTSLGFSTLGVYMMLKTMGYAVDAYNWIPIVSFSFILFLAAWAILSLPFVMISEIFPEKVKDAGASFCLSLIWFLSFIVIKYLPLLNEVLQFHGSMFLFAGVCLFSAIVIIKFLPETKGKSYEEIMEMLR